MDPFDVNMPDVIEIEKKLLSAMMLKRGSVIPLVSKIVEADDFYRPEHRIIFRAITQIYFGGMPPDILGNRAGTAQIR